MIPRRLRSWLAGRRGNRTASHDDPAAGAARLELEIRGVADALWAGTRTSVFRGSGMEVDGVRGYVAGDDTRAVDWKVTARTGRLHVRELVEERATDVVLLLDRSAGLHGGPSWRPGHAARLAAGILASAADRSGHRVGLVDVAATVGTVLPPSLRRTQVEAVLATVAVPAYRPGPCAVGAGLERVRALLAARALVIVISDFRVPEAERTAVASVLARLARRHDVLPVRVRNPGPEDLPPVGCVGGVGTSPRGGRVLDTSDPRWRAVERAAAEERASWWRALVSSLRLDPLELDPFTSVGGQIRAGLERRRRRAA